MKSTTVCLFACLMLITFSLKPHSSGYEHEDNFLTTCCTPLNLTQPRSIHNFLHSVFSDRRYAHDYLPYNLCTHLMSFLEHGKGLEKQIPYAESSIRLFYNKLKASPFVCNQALSKMLDCMPHIIKTYCAPSAESSFLSSMENNMMGIFVPTFLSQFSLFRSNPEDFLKKLAHDVTTMVQNSFTTYNHVAREQLRQMFIRFIDLGLMKLIWTPTQQEAVWDSIKTISIQLSDAMELGVITTDELDDFYKSLLESFYRFLDLTGSELSRSVIETMKEDVCSDTLLLFVLEEQETALETKKERTLQILLEAEAKIEARSHGIITDLVVCQN